jgi:hypothetical protein
MSDPGKGGSNPGKHESCPISAGIREDLRVGGQDRRLPAAGFVSTRFQTPWSIRHGDVFNGWCAVGNILARQHVSRHLMDNRHYP